MTNNIRNKAVESGFITIDLIDYEPQTKSLGFDIKDGLFMGLMLKEKEFKTFLSNVDWEKYNGRPVAIVCSADTIIPTWAYMLVAERLSGIAGPIDYTSPELLDIHLWNQNIKRANFSAFNGQKVVVRQRQNIAPALYVSITDKLKPIVKTLMYGEVGLPKVIFKKQIPL